MSGIHPSKDILFSSSRLMEGKKVALGICGSVACIRSPEIARGLMRHGGEVWAVMTRAAQELISPALMEWATGNPVVTTLTGKIEHVALGCSDGDGADVVLVAPATANTIGKIACGIDDTPVTSLVTAAIGSGVPVIVAPAMHSSMLRHPAVLENIKRLGAMGVRVLLPEVAEGKAKLIPEEEIVEEVLATLRPKDMVGFRVLITSGPTRSYMDSVRFLTNSSSGKMGVAFAREAAARGAEVTLVSGPVEIPRLRAKVMRVTSTREMMHSVLDELSSSRYDLAVMAAAPLDFDIADPVRGKISSDSPIDLHLVPNQKILAEAKRLSPDTFVIGFKAEFGLGVEELISRARARLEASGCDMIVANDLSSPGRGFASDTDEVYVLSGDGSCIHIPLKPKRELVGQILDSFLRRRNKT